ncbi:unnamed protein product, partial [Mesorhabditis belari]|uniref:Uncharacterized protein n=1 Tax=Mesorhabditis belari TaxID=2138241 RepID=A0AAF3J6A9_9BILA
MDINHEVDLFLLIGFLIWRTILNTDHSSTKVQMELLFEEPFLNPDLPPIKTEEWAEQLQSFIAKRNQMRKIIFTWTSGDCEGNEGILGKLKKKSAPKNQGKGGFQKLKNLALIRWMECHVNLAKAKKKGLDLDSIRLEPVIEIAVE